MQLNETNEKNRIKKAKSDENKSQWQEEDSERQTDKGGTNREN